MSEKPNENLSNEVKNEVGNNEKIVFWAHGVDNDAHWVALVIAKHTGIVYHNQCGGHGCMQKYIEGFIVPMASKGLVEKLTELFTTQTHLRETELISQLTDIVERVRISRSQYFDVLANDTGGEYVWDSWGVYFESDEHREWLKKHSEKYADPPEIKEEFKARQESFYLELDLERWNDATEAWLPVKTHFGPGVLMFQNSD